MQLEIILNCRQMSSKVIQSMSKALQHMSNVLQRMSKALQSTSEDTRVETTNLS